MRLGIIGGLGPMATAYFMELLINMTDAKCDQDHLEMIIYNCQSIPDRTAYILGKSNANPVVPIIKIGKKLKEQNVECISIPCITAHYFHDEIEEKTGCKVMHAIRDTSYLLKEAGLTKIGIMATDGTIQSRIFQNEIEKNGMHGLVPDKKYQKIVMDIIYKDIKAGKIPDIEKYNVVATHLKNKGAQVIILGCTELSLLKKQYDIKTGVIDAMEVLAKSSLIQCNKRVKPKYNKLFVPFN